VLEGLELAGYVWMLGLPTAFVADCDPRDSAGVDMLLENCWDTRIQEADLQMDWEQSPSQREVVRQEHMESHKVEVGMDLSMVPERVWSIATWMIP